MNQKYVQLLCSQTTAFLMGFKCNFHFMLVYTFRFVFLSVMTSESARVSDLSPHVIFAVKWHIQNLWPYSCYDW